MKLNSVEMITILPLLILVTQGAVYQIESNNDLDFEVWFQPPKPPNTHYLTLQSEGDDYVFLELKNSRYELTILQGESHEIYTLPATQPQTSIIFEWPMKLIDGQSMKKVLHQGNISLPKLDKCKLVTSTTKATFYTEGGKLPEGKLLEDGDLSKLTYQCDTNEIGVYFILIPIFVICVLASRVDLLQTLWRRYRQITEAEEDLETDTQTVV